MKIYLVGGAVRDAQLGQRVQERDWVVVGSTPEAMEALGFKRVGRSFPVFLHPQTHEEYALARLEMPTGPKHTDFKLRFSPETTLEEDLQRRDLTINAMAQGDEGLIDPYGGLNDLKQGVFRHVSKAFTDDALRVLRVARFAATSWGQRFEVAPETEELLTSMVKAGMLNQLSKERIWGELTKAFQSANPARTLKLLYRWGAWAQWGLAWPLSAKQLLEAFGKALQLPCTSSPQLRYALWLEMLSEALEREGSELSVNLWHEKLGAPPLFRNFADWSQKQRLAIQSGFWSLQAQELKAIPWFELLGPREERSLEALELKMDWLVTKRWLDKAEWMESEKGLWPSFKSEWARKFEAAWRLKLSAEDLKALKGAERAQALQSQRKHFLQRLSQEVEEQP